MLIKNFFVSGQKPFKWISIAYRSLTCNIKVTRESGARNENKTAVTMQEYWNYRDELCEVERMVMRDKKSCNSKIDVTADV